MSLEITTDISTPKEAKGLRAENLREILNNMGDPVFVKDRHSRLILVNDAFCEMFALPRAEIIGKTLAEDVSPEEREHFLKIDKEVLASGKERIVEESLTVRGGATRTISTRKSRYIDKQGNTYLIGIIRDITERKNAEEVSRLNKLNELLLRAAQALSEPDKDLSKAISDLTELVADQFNAVCDVSVLKKEEGIIQPIAVHHQDSEVRTIVKDLFKSMVVKEGQGLVGSVIEKGEEVLIQDVPDSMKHGPAKVSPKIIPVSLIYVPLRGSTGVLGSMNLTRLTGAGRFSENDILQIRRIGQYVSLFVENILLRDHREELFELRKQSEQRLSSEKRWIDFKIEVSELLADVETELEDVLQNLCIRITEFFDVVTDFQLVQEDDETIKLVALYHSDMKVKSAIEEILDRPQMKVGEGMVGAVVESGRELYLEKMPPSMMQKVKEQKVNPLIVPNSLAYLPLKSRGNILGTLDLTRLSGQPGISEHELNRMRDLATYAASFIENRLLQRKQQHEIELRKRTEKRLERSTKMLERMEAETRQMLNAIPVYIARISKDLRYVFLNDAYKKRGVEPRKLEGKHINELLGEEGLKALSGMIECALNGEVVSFEHEVTDKQGEQKFMSVALAPDFSENGDVVGFYSCSTDITPQMLAERTAQLTQERFESLSMNSGDAFFFHDEDQNILDVNQVASEMLGYSRAELLALKARDIDPRWSQNMYQRFLKDLDENVPQTFETSVVAKDGRKIPVESRFVKRVEDGKMYIQSLLRDRTEKRAQEKRLLESEQNLRLVFDNVEDYIATIDVNGTIQSINKTDESIRPEEVIGSSIYNFFNSDEAVEEVKRKFPELIKTGKGFEVEDPFYGTKGEQIFSIKYNAVLHEGSFLKAIVILRDITAERTREHSVMNAAIRGQEQERKRLGAELHDGIGQVLSAIALKASRMNEILDEQSRKSFSSDLSELNENLQSAIKEVRDISHDLMPDVLEGFGLKQALSQTCNNLQERSGMVVTFSHFDLNKRYNPTLELNLYRIAQELLNNAQKHASSKQIFVTLMDHGELLSLTVEDDGIGFNLKDTTDGIGLKNIRSRVNLMRGKFDVESASNSGTLINIEVPKALK